MPLMTRVKTSWRCNKDKDNADDDDDTTSLLTCSSSTDEEQQHVAVGGGKQQQRSSWTTPPSLRKLGRHLQRHSSHHHRHNNGQGDERSACSQNSGAGNGCGRGGGSGHTRRSLLNFRRNHTEHGVCETRQSLLRKEDDDAGDISESNNDEYPATFRPLRARGQTWDGTMKETTPTTIKGTTTPSSTKILDNNDDDDDASLSSFGSFANERGCLDEDVIESDIIDEDDGSEESFADTALCRIKCQAVVPLPARVLTLWITSPDSSARHLELDLHSCVDAREKDDQTTHEAARTVACCGL